MANFWTSREQLKRAGQINGIEKSAIVDRHIEGASRFIERETRRFFIPRIETRLYRWPKGINRRTTLYLDQDLISVTTLQSEAQDSSPTTIPATDFFLEPTNTSPPFNRIEIDLSSDAFFSAGDTPQRSISVLGSWGYSEDTRSVGTVDDSSGISTSDTTLIVSDASLIDVGDTLLIESEQIFVSDRSFAAKGNVLINDASVVAQMNNVTITLDGSHGVLAGETIRLQSELLFVEMVDTNDLTVTRAYDGSVLAVHANDTAVHINRTLTIERGINGTTAATHADTTAISKYEPPFDVRNWCLGLALASLTQEQAHWGRSVGTGDGASEFRSVDLAGLTKKMKGLYQRMRVGAV